ncbi:hypothetical protein HanPSC8_Chr09g0397691 [Helianthus annuus]|nr:hypothetical protein HanPSC8_Chr09g0397691 [Helianthus annuus]
MVGKSALSAGVSFWTAVPLSNFLTNKYSSSSSSVPSSSYRGPSFSSLSHKSS